MSQLKQRNFTINTINIYYQISFDLKQFFAMIKYLKQQCSFG